jgi:RNA polymerase sigma factor (sigma-70 family)
MVNWTEVCEQHRGLVFTIARRYLSACIHDPAIDLDDLMQTGFIGLMQAAETHDETKGSFAHWAAYYIRQEIRLLLSMHRKLPRIRVMELSLDAPVMDGEEPSLGDAVAADVDVEAGADRQEITQAVNEAVDRLPDKQRDLVRLCDLQGRSLSDAARVCDTSLPSAQNTHKIALKTLFFDENLRALAIAHELDEWTEWHHHVGVANYRSTWVSSTEALVFDRENRRQKLMKKYAMTGPLSGAK